MDPTRGNQLQRAPELPPRPNKNSSSIHNTTISPPAYSYHDRDEPLQGKGRKASGYYQHAIRNDDVPRDRFFPAVGDSTYPKKGFAINRANASGVFNKSIVNDDITRPAPQPVFQLDPLPSDDRSIYSRGFPSDFKASQNTGGVNKSESSNKYWHTKDSGVVVKSQSSDSKTPHHVKRVSQLIGTDLTSVETTRTARPNSNSTTDQMGKPNAIDRVFEWQTTEGDAVNNNVYQNVSLSSPLHQQVVLKQRHQRIARELLLQPQTLLPRIQTPALNKPGNTKDLLVDYPDSLDSLSMSAVQVDGNYPHAMNGHFNPPVSFEYPKHAIAHDATATFEALPGWSRLGPESCSNAKQKKTGCARNDVILIVVVVVCFFVTAAVVVILVKAV